MNLQKLFKTQKILDDRILEEKGLEGQDLLPEKILALQVELGELANEWRVFKFWSENREPRTKARRKSRDFLGKPIAINRNPLLEEYVDCLHFILSIGNELGFQNQVRRSKIINLEKDILEQFSMTFGEVVMLEESRFLKLYEILMNIFLGLGDLLGFTLKQIETAYYSKNKINHARQENGY